MPSSLVGLNADKTTLHVWRFDGDETKDEPMLSLNAFPEYAKTHVWEEFNVDGRNLIAAKRSLDAREPSHALSVVVYDLISGDLLWTVRRLPCRSLDRRCSMVSGRYHPIFLGQQPHHSLRQLLQPPSIIFGDRGHHR